MLSLLRSSSLAEDHIAAALSHYLWLHRLVASFAFPEASDPPCEGASKSTGPLTLLLYGSIVTGTSLRGGDIDYALCTAECARCVQTGQGASRGWQVAALNALRNHCKQRSGAACLDGGTVHADIISGARLPILQCRSCLPTTKAEAQKFDLCVSLTGVRNSLFLRDYVVSGGDQLCAGLLLVKMWGRAEGVTNAYKGFLSPYALTIMYVYFMKTTKRMNVCIDESDLSSYRRYLVMLQHFQQTQCAECSSDGRAICSGAECSRHACMSYFLRPLQSVRSNACSLVESSINDDVRHFFHFFGDDSLFDFDSAVVDLRSHDAYRAASDWSDHCRNLCARRRWNLLGHEVMHIRDPFEDHNLARGVNFIKAEAIRDAFRRASKIDNVIDRITRASL